MLALFKIFRRKKLSIKKRNTLGKIIRGNYDKDGKFYYSDDGHIIFSFSSDNRVNLEWTTVIRKSTPV